MTSSVKNVTKLDVAKMANVSHMTVSRVLSGSANVSEDTRRKVMSACKKLNYRRNILASSLRNRKTNTIGLVVPTLSHNFYARLTRGIEQTCGESGYHMIMVQGYGPNDTLMGWEDFEFLLARQIDGILMDYPCDDDIIKRLEKEDIPVVFIDHPPRSSRFSYIATDDYQGSRELGQYLIDKGHTKIACLRGPEFVQNSRYRFNGYLDAMKENELPIDQNLIAEQGYTLEGGYSGMKILLEGKLDFTAVMCANDYMAIGAIQALDEEGKKVPDDVSVVGFAGDSITGFTLPPLTTMLQPAEDIGKQAFRMLFDQIEGKSPFDSQVLVKTRLIERKSVRDLK